MSQVVKSDLLLYADDLYLVLQHKDMCDALRDLVPFV